MGGKGHGGERGTKQGRGTRAGRGTRGGKGHKGQEQPLLGEPPLRPCGCHSQDTNPR